MSKTQLLSAEEAAKLIAFRDDLRKPHVVFSRCAITGVWGKCIALDMGDLVFHAPNIEEGVIVDPDSGKVTFTKYDPVVYSNQATFSETGLQMLLDYCRSQDNPIPTVTPDLIYQWQVLYDDGSVLCQFRADDHGNEIEATSKDIDFAHIRALNVIPRLVPADALPSYSFVPATGEFYRGSERIDTGYDRPYMSEAEPVYCRKVAHTWSSQMGTGLDRSIAPVHTTVLQIMGWKVGGIAAVVSQQNTPGCLIAIDERGNWRPYEYAG